MIEREPFFSYELLDPAFWFDKLATFFYWIFKIIFSPELWSLVDGILFFLTFFFISIICYSAIRVLEIRHKEHKHLHHEMAEYAERQKEREKNKRAGENISKNPRWVQVLDHLSSPNVNDWKLAIIEADSMLESLMGDLGFKGESLGDKLKSADRNSFRSLTVAWEVHTIRNRIAHEGSAFDLSLYEAKRVIASYEQIFREFGYV